LPDILANSADIREIRHPLDPTPEESDRVLAVNPTGSFAVAQAFAPQLRELGRTGAFVNFASTSGLLAAE
jgi:meso-butanediol dehydrogenase / (S,S)-butanediol dehydrogenase / diacetyl reductase